MHNRDSGIYCYGSWLNHYIHAMQHISIILADTKLRIERMKQHEHSRRQAKVLLERDYSAGRADGLTVPRQNLQLDLR